MDNRELLALAEGQKEYMVNMLHIISKDSSARLESRLILIPSSTQRSPPIWYRYI